MKATYEDPYDKARRLRTERLVCALGRSTSIDYRTPIKYVDPEMSEQYIEHFSKSEQEYANVLSSIDPDHPLLEIATDHMLSRLYQDPYLFEDKDDDSLWEDSPKNNILTMLLATIACHAKEMVCDKVDNPREFSATKVKELRDQIMDNLDYRQLPKAQQNTEDIPLVSVEVMDPEDTNKLIATPALDYSILALDCDQSKVRPFIDDLLLYSLDFMNNIPQYQQDSLDDDQLVNIREEKIDLPNQEDRIVDALIAPFEASTTVENAEASDRPGSLILELPDPSSDQYSRMIAQRASARYQKKRVSGGNEAGLEDTTSPQEKTAISFIDSIKKAIRNMSNRRTDIEDKANRWMPFS